MNQAKSIDVLVVGAGPTGLSAAAELRRRGLSCRLVEKAEAPAPWSKAQIIHARTLEIFEQLGIVEAVLSRGKAVHGFNMYSTPGMKRVLHFPIQGIDSALGHFLSLPQRDTEALLAQRLEELGGAVERGVELEGFTQDATGVTAALVHPGGRAESVRASWLIGCDGAHSIVRETLGLPFEGSTYAQRLIQADVRVDMPFHVDDDELVGFVSAGGLVALFPLPGERRYRLVVPLFDQPDLEPTLENFQAVMAQHGPPGAVVSDPVWTVAFKIHCRMVSRYRVGRVFLAGDAAHIHSPAGGQGMNTGIQDAWNLAWKLDLVHRGAARDELLDSYDAERRPVAAATLAMTDRGWRGGMAAFGLRHPIATAMRDRLMGFIGSLGLAARMPQAISMLDIGYPDSPAVAQDRPSILNTQVLTDTSQESPSLRDWLDFGSGPAPGDRAPDVRIAPEDEGSPRLHALFSHLDHTLLLFDGAAHTEEGYRNLASVAGRVEERYGERIRPHLVIPLAARPGALAWDVPVLLDPAGAVHRRYGARSECLYLVRPDGHVAYRSQPADGDRLMAYLDRIFRSGG